MKFGIFCLLQRVVALTMLTLTCSLMPAVPQGRASSPPSTQAPSPLPSAAPQGIPLFISECLAFYLADYCRFLIKCEKLIFA